MLKEAKQKSVNGVARPELEISENALAVLQRRYLRRGADGKPVESVPEMFFRVASNVAAVEDEGEARLVTEAFYELLTTFRFMPNSPTFTGAGTPLGQLAACFVLAIEDDMGKESAGIFQTLRDAALIQQTGGGNGFAFSRLRPKGALVKSSAGQATGPVGFLRVYDQAFGEIAQGGCLLPETLVFTDKGVLRLDEIAQTEQAGWQAHALQVATDDGWRSSPRAFNNGVAPVLRLHTAQGLSLAGTPEHRVKIMTPEGLQWRQLRELQRGDWIMVQLGQQRGTYQTLRHPTRQHGNQVWPKLPAILDEELAFFLGYLAGDGFVAAGADDNRVGVSVAHSSYLMMEMPALLQRTFGVNVHRQQKKADRSVTFVMDNRAVKTFLAVNGFDKKSSAEVSVPRLIRQSPPEVVGAYLRGLFEADGTLTHGYPTLTTTSARLVEEAATLLIGLGCPVQIRAVSHGVGHWGEARMYHVRIVSTVGLEAWRARIGCDPRSRFVAAYAWETDQGRESSYRLPHAGYWIQPALEAITLEQVDRRGRGTGAKLRSLEPQLRRQLQRYLRGERHFTRSAYEALAAAHPVFAEQARPLSDLWFVRVTGVEEAGEALTLDLEVDDNHTYLAYGMVTHNTRRGANMAVLQVNHPDILEFISCKASEHAITNFNISVGITDDFMAAVRDDEDFELVNPQDGSMWQTVRARKLFDEIVKYAYNNGEPGMLFLDAANRSNPVPHLYKLEATNPCVTGDTLIYTANGLYRAAELAAGGAVPVVVDGRFGVDTVQPASPVFATGIQDVYRLTTEEGYELRLTASHQVMTTRGWVAAGSLQPGDQIHILNRAGAFGVEGSRELGLVLGWLVGDGTVNQIRAVLSFFGSEKSELAPTFAAAVTTLVDKDARYKQRRERSYPVTPLEIAGRDEVRMQSDRLRRLAEEHGLDLNKLQVPDVVFQGSQETQQAFLQALFTADGTVNDGGVKGGSVRLTSISNELLQDVQRLLLNFGIASHIYRQRRSAGWRELPDGQGGMARYWCQAYHELAISKDNLQRFAQDIGFLSQAKQTALLDYLARMTRGPYRETFVARVRAVEPDGQEMVYDLTQPETNSFIANGFVVHNCGEQWLGPNENCCLGSINLAQHLGPDGTVDWQKLAETTAMSTRFLDDVVSANAYVPAVPQLKEAAFRARRIGLGIMGLADLMYHAGIRYGSGEGQEFAAQVMEFVRFHCMKTSIELAEARGPFPAIQGSIYDPEDLKWTPPHPLSPYERDFGRPALDWEEVTAGIRQHGIRNAAQTTVAPTGTIATVSGCEGYGCEPVFALAYIRHVNDNGKDLQLTYTSPLFEKALVQAGLDQATRTKIIDHVMQHGTCQDLAELPAALRHVFVVSQDITAEEHVYMQAAIQAFVDNSLSKTCNFPATAQPDDVAKAYMLAWELGCKGLTVYVTGSREKVVLETHATKKAKDTAGAVPAEAVQQPALWPAERKKPRPKLLKGLTHRITTPLGNTYVTINENGGDQPFEVFLQTSKAGSDTAAVSEAIGRLISYILRLSSPIAPRERLREVVKQLGGIGGGRPLGFGSNRVLSLPDGVAQVLNDYLLNAPLSPASGQPKPDMQRLPIGDLCPECGEAAVVNEEGCRKCYACGYSEC